MYKNGKDQQAQFVDNSTTKSAKSYPLQQEQQYSQARLNRWSLLVEENKRNSDFFKKETEQQEQAPYSSSFKNNQQIGEESGEQNSYIAHLIGQTKVADIYNNSAPFEDDDEDNVPS